MNSKQKKAIIITLIAILLLILIYILIILSLTPNDNQENDFDISGGYTSIKQIVEANGCKYIKDYVNEEDEYPIQIELKFKYDLYTDDTSNEKFYMKIINETAKFVRYKNIKMIDEEKDITIEIECNDSKIKTIKINEIEDYFIYMDSQISVSKYKEIKTVQLEANSEILTALFEGNWDTEINCGTRDSIFNSYHIFFDEGIEYRKIGSKIYNMVFTEKYPNTVVGNIRPGESVSSVKLKLGDPSFEDKDLGVIGYKAKDFYVFFNGKEISIYRNIKIDYSDFWKLVDEFIKDDSDMSFKDFMNELTYIWPDYSEYEYNAEYMFISYPNKGIDIKFNYENEDGIVVYNNISENLDRVKRYVKNTEFLSKLQIDDVFEAEKRRMKKTAKLEKNSDEFWAKLKEELKPNEEPSCGESELYKFYMDLDDNGFVITAYFISKTGNEVNRELNEPMSSYVWISDNLLVYGIERKGIYCYNVLDGSKQTLMEGDEAYHIKKFEDNIIYYDNGEMNISF